MSARNGILTILLALVSSVTAAPGPEFFGIGAVIGVTNQHSGPQIKSIIRDSPAAKAKLSAGLIITKIDDAPTQDMKLEECSKRLLGAEGTTVRIEAMDPSSGKTIDIALKREKVALENVSK